MKAHSINDKELRKDIYKLRRELRADIREVRGLSKDDSLIPTTAVTQMRELEKSMRKRSVAKMDTKELLSTYRQLKYIRGLKSSTVQGAISTSISFEPIRRNIESLSKNKQEEWWSIYGDMYGVNPSIVYDFKYEIFEAIDRLFMGGTDSDNIIEAIIKVIDEAYILQQNGASRFEISVHIANKIKEIL